MMIFRIPFQVFPSVEVASSRLKSTDIGRISISVTGSDFRDMARYALESIFL